jgi:hypothetical protein
MMAAPKKAQPVVARDMERDIGAAKVLKAHLVEILGEEAADAETVRDAIEGETGLFETICAVVGQIGEDEASAEGIKLYISRQAARKSRLEKRAELLRTALMNAIDLIGDPMHREKAEAIAAAITARAMAALTNGKLDATVATVTLKAVPPKLTVVNEGEIPSNFWKTPEPELDRTSLTTALKDHRDTLAQKLAELDERRKAEPMDDATYADLRARIIAAFPQIPGAELSNGGGTVQIRFS